MSCTRMTTLAFLLLVLFPFVIFDRDYPLILCPLCKSKTLWNTFMILGRNVEHDGSHWRRRQRKTSCPLCNLNNLWNILMILGRNLEQDQTMCRVQK